MMLESSYGRGRLLPYTELINFKFLAALFAATLIVAFQSQILPFFEPLLISGGNIWRITYYGFWGFAALCAMLLVIQFAWIRTAIAPTVLVCLYAFALVALHPLDPVAKNFVVAIFLVLCLTVLIALLPWQTVARFSATVTALMATVALVDILFREGFTTTGGRAAGLSLNPNVAAAGLLLGAVATYKALPKRWQFPFLSLVAAALLGTLSRSTMMVGVMAGVFVIVSGILSKGLAWRPQLPNRRHFIQNGLLLLFLAGWLGLAAMLNSYYTYSMRTSFSGLQTAITALAEAEKKYGWKLPDLTASFRSDSGTEGMGDGFSTPGDADSSTSQERKVVKAVDSDGEVNSAGTRALLLKRSLNAFLSGPFFGIGLEQAYDYHPHNTYLLLAVAFGWPGLLVPFGILALTVFRVRRFADLSFGLTAAGLMFFSHDILLVPGLLVSLVIGIAAQRNPAPRDQSTQACASAFKLVTILTTLLFFLGAATVAIGHSGRVSAQLDPDKIFPADHFVYYANMKPLQFIGLLRSIDTNSEPDGMLKLYEDGRTTASGPLFRPSERLHGGQYYQWRNSQIVFTASDYSDPRDNGRSYSVDYTVGVHPLMYLTLAAIFGWCVGVVFLFGGRFTRGKG